MMKRRMRKEKIKGKRAEGRRTKEEGRRARRQQQGPEGQRDTRVRRGLGDRPSRCQSCRRTATMSMGEWWWRRCTAQRGNSGERRTMEATATTTHSDRGIPRRRPRTLTAAETSSTCTTTMKRRRRQRRWRQQRVPSIPTATTVNQHSDQLIDRSHQKQQKQNVIPTFHHNCLLIIIFSLINVHSVVLFESRDPNFFETRKMRKISIWDRDSRAVLAHRISSPPPHTVFLLPNFAAQSSISFWCVVCCPLDPIIHSFIFIPITSICLHLLSCFFARCYAVLRRNKLPPPSACRATWAYCPPFFSFHNPFIHYYRIGHTSPLFARPIILLSLLFFGCLFSLLLSSLIIYLSEFCPFL